MDNQSSGPPHGGFRPSLMVPLPRRSQAPNMTPTPDSLPASQSLSGAGTSLIDELIGLDGWGELLKPRHGAPSQTRPTRFPCDICGLVFNSSQTLETHKQTHGPYYVCLICPGDPSNGKHRFSTQILLNEHLRKAHRRHALKWDALNHVELRYEDQDKFQLVVTPAPMATLSQVPGLSGDPGSNVSKVTKAMADVVAVIWEKFPLQLGQPGLVHNLGRVKQGKKGKTNLATGGNSSQDDFQVLKMKVESLQSKVKELSQSTGLRSIASNLHKLVQKAAKNKRKPATEKGMDEANSPPAPPPEKEPIVSDPVLPAPPRARGRPRKRPLTPPGNVKPKRTLGRPKTTLREQGQGLECPEEDCDFKCFLQHHLDQHTESHKSMEERNLNHCSKCNRGFVLKANAAKHESRCRGSA